MDDHGGLFYIQIYLMIKEQSSIMKTKRSKEDFEDPSVSVGGGGVHAMCEALGSTVSAVSGHCFIMPSSINHSICNHQSTCISVEPCRNSVSRGLGASGSNTGASGWLVGAPPHFTLDLYLPCWQFQVFPT